MQATSPCKVLEDWFHQVRMQGRQDTTTSNKGSTWKHRLDDAIPCVHNLQHRTYETHRPQAQAANVHPHPGAPTELRELWRFDEAAVSEGLSWEWSTL